ncbi:hypothetical protein GW17_00060893 [Ensete ventricosum]|nr:hypothetical protein GW17_00060893 [Ensete ventricosum]
MARHATTVGSGRVTSCLDPHQPDSSRRGGRTMTSSHRFSVMTRCFMIRDYYRALRCGMRRKEGISRLFPASREDPSIEKATAFSCAPQSLVSLVLPLRPVCASSPTSQFLRHGAELVGMSGDSGVGSRVLLLEWRSLVGEEVVLLGSAAGSCKEVGSGKFPT